MSLSFYLGLVLPLLAPLVVIRALVVVPLLYGVFPYHYLTGILMMSMLMSASYLLFKRSNLWPYGIWFCVFYLLVLLWQLPVAVATFWKSEWGTRNTSADVAAQEKRKYIQEQLEMPPDLEGGEAALGALSSARQKHDRSSRDVL